MRWSTYSSTKYTELAMPPKANTAVPPMPPAEPGVSGKFVIMGILGLAFVAGAGSWLFRYNATHRAAQFWGPNGARLIRDASEVGFYEKPYDRLVTLAQDPFAAQKRIDAAKIDISHARGLAHLRNALLEDRSFDWSAPKDELGTLLFTPGSMRPPSDSQMFNIYYWWLSFRDPGNDETITIFFSEDGRRATKVNTTRNEIVAISTEPIAKGLREIFAEFAALRKDSPALPDKPADGSPVPPAR
jgi:hypothetical protein